MCSSTEHPPSFVILFSLQWNSSENPNGLQQVKKQEMGKLLSYAMENYWQLLQKHYRQNLQLPHKKGGEKKSWKTV